MSRNAKIGIGIVIGLVVLCLCVCIGGVAVFTLAGGGMLERMMITDPEQVRGMASEVLGYELPAGYQEISAMDFFTGRMIFIQGEGDGSTENRPMILITEILSEDMLDTDQFREQFQGQVQQAMQRQPVDWELVDQSERTLRGQEVVVYTYEGQTSGGPAMRQITTDVFTGEAGVVFLTLIASQDDWPQAEFDAFLESIQ